MNLSHVPILHGLVSVKGLNGQIATTEEWAEKGSYTEKAKCARASEVTVAMQQPANVQHQEADSSCCQHQQQHI